MIKFKLLIVLLWKIRFTLHYYTSTGHINLLFQAENSCDKNIKLWQQKSLYILMDLFNLITYGIIHEYLIFPWFSSWNELFFPQNVMQLFCCAFSRWQIFANQNSLMVIPSIVMHLNIKLWIALSIMYCINIRFYMSLSLLIIYNFWLKFVINIFNLY